MCPEDEGLLEPSRSAKPNAYQQARWEELLLRTTTSRWGAVGPPRARDRPRHAPSPEPTLPRAGWGGRGWRGGGPLLPAPCGGRPAWVSPRVPLCAQDPSLPWVPLTSQDY